MHYRRFKAAIIVLLPIVAMACARTSRTPLSPGPVGQQQELEKSRAEQEPEVVLGATAIGNRVHIEVKNNRAETLIVDPHFFGVIVNRKLTRFNPATAVNQFPVSRLKQGETASGYLIFLDFSDLVGQKLVFRNPDYKPLMTVIRAEPE
jgi:hypothetical protein